MLRDDHEALVGIEFATEVGRDSYDIVIDNLKSNSLSIGGLDKETIGTLTTRARSLATCEGG